MHFTCNDIRKYVVVRCAFHVSKYTRVYEYNALKCELMQLVTPVLLARGHAHLPVSVAAWASALRSCADE